MSQTLPKLTVYQQSQKKNMPVILGRSIINFSKISESDKTTQAQTPKLTAIRINLSVPDKQKSYKRYDKPLRLFAFERYLKRHTISRYPKGQPYHKSRNKKFNMNEDLITEQGQSENPQIKISRKTNLLLMKPKAIYESIPKFFSREKEMYRFYVGPGNNGELVKKILLSRSCWIQTTEHDTLFNLKWEQYTDKNMYDRIVYDQWKQTVNHFKMHEQISTKAGLIKSLKKYCGRNGMDLFEFVPISFVLDMANPTKLEEELKKFIFYYIQNNPNPTTIKKDRCYIDFVKSLTSHFIKFTNFSFEKTTTQGIPPLGSAYINAYDYIWLLKPSQLNRGRGIKIWNNLQSLSQILIKSATNKFNGDHFVIQKYIERPMLIKDRKFDIRVWVLLSQKSKIYIFEEGYIRTSCEQFNLSVIDNEYIHLTNNAIQKSNKKYGQFQDGNQMSFDNFDRFFPQFGPFKVKIMPQIKRICQLTILSGLKMMVDPKKKESFEIFGFDFMLDYNCKVWLIEVNTNPCIQTSSKLLQRIIPRMLDDAFKIVLDPIFPIAKNNNKYSVDNYDDDVNMWCSLIQ